MDEDTKSYIDVYFEQLNDDWLKVPGQNTQTGYRVEARKCT
jgi:hypothetical protein